MKRLEVPEALLEDVKNYLNITWKDEATDNKIRGLIASGTVYLDGKAGGPLDYDVDGPARTLLMDYVRYVRDEALDVFENNYLAYLLALQNERRVTDYVESASEAET
nr:MAG TPA: Head Tail Connector Protein [Caudoviricetes sp.]